MMIPIKKFDDLLKDYEPGHSEFQIRNFIVGAEVHPWHRYQQCLREIAGRRETVQSARKMLDSMDARIGRLERKIFRRKKNRLEIEELRFQKNSLEQKMQVTVRELTHFIALAVNIRKKYGFGNLSHEKKNILEGEAWREKAKFMLCMDLFCVGRHSKQTIEFIYKLPKKEKRELLMEIDPRDQQKIIEYLTS